jgi:Na+/H+-dicarboxylate symporter
LVYVLIIYLVGSYISNTSFKKNISSMLPAGFTAFSTMSSVATMPLTLIATEKNLKSRPLSQLIIPSTVNIHVMGDNLMEISLLLALLVLFGMPFPTYEHFVYFGFFYSVAKLSAVGLPGGNVIIMMPLIQKFFDLNGDMISILTALFIIMDPLITCTNVMGNGGFALSFSKLLEKMGVIKELNKKS